MLVVQHIQVIWTKASRGAPGAVQRNAVPEVFELPPAIVGQTADLLVHQVIVRESNAFTPRIGDVVNEVLAPLALGMLELRPEEGLARVVTRDGPTLVVPLGEWGRIRTNCRHSDYDTGQWYYSKDVVNVAVCARPDRGLFQGEPDQYVDAERRLR